MLKRKKKRYDIETLSVDRVLNKERFYGKSYMKYTPEASRRSLFNFGEQPKTAIVCKKFF